MSNTDIEATLFSQQLRQAGFSISFTPEKISIRKDGSTIEKYFYDLEAFKNFIRVSFPDIKLDERDFPGSDFKHSAHRNKASADKTTSLRRIDDGAPRAGVNTAWKVFLAVFGFLLGASVSGMILVATLMVINVSLGADLRPRGAGWVFIAIASGIGCAKFFLNGGLRRVKFVAPNDRSTKAWIAASLGWGVVIAGWVLLFDPFGYSISDKEYMFLTKIYTIPISVAFICYALFTWVRGPRSVSLSAPPPRQPEQ